MPTFCSNPEMNHDVDRQIRDALRVEPSIEQVERLERFWHEQLNSTAPDRRVRFHRPVLWAAGAAAAVVAVACLTTGLRSRMPVGSPVVRQDAGADKKSPTVAPSLSTGRVAVAVPAPVERPRATFPRAGREPTAYERILFAARSPVPLDVDPAGDRIAAASAGAKVHPGVMGGSPAVARRDSGGRDASHTLNGGRDGATGDSLAVHAESGQAKPSTERPLAPDQLVYLIRTASHPRRRAELLQQLLASDSDAATDCYLELVDDPATRREAIAAAEVVSGPLLERLLERLEDKDRRVRLAAAIVLARADGPEVAAALVELVTRDASPPSDDARRTEAWMALVACRDRRTHEFLAYASVQPRLLRHLNRARVQWERMTLYPL